MKTISFRDLTTFRTGGNIKHFFAIKDKNDLVERVRFAKENKLPIFIIGGGSDILVSDEDFDGVVLKYVADKITRDGDIVTAEAGLEWDKLVEYAVNKNLGGIESLSAIPGTVGGAPIQNIGAYGQELKDTFLRLLAYDIDKEEFKEFSKDECHFEYRDSIFKNKEYWQRFVICEVSLKLLQNYTPTVKYESLNKYLNLEKNHTLREVREAVTQVRSERLEDWKINPNAGSYFKNPIIDENKKRELESKYSDVKIYPYKDKFKIFAGWLVENAGWKGRSLGNVKVSSKHALIIINSDGLAKSSDVLTTANKIKEDVYKKFKIKLESEVQYIHFLT